MNRVWNSWIAPGRRRWHNETMTDSRAALRLTAILASYGRFHRDPCNRLTHYFGVPAIIYAVLIPLAIHVHTLAGVPLHRDRIVIALAALGYIVLDPGLGLALTLALALLGAAAEETCALGPSMALAVAAGVFVLGWMLQLLGHRLEGNRPALLTNLAQILVAPLYLTAELGFSMGLRLRLRGAIARHLTSP
ncbi:MAG: Mpo1-like protein [Steroidobacteraceae bacterium]